MKPKHPITKSVEKERKNDYVVLDMENVYNARKEKPYMVDQQSLANSKRSLKHFYLESSCSVCSERYKISKGTHSCDAKSRCNFKQKDYIEDLETIDTNQDITNNTPSVMQPLATSDRDQFSENEVMMYIRKHVS